jgi:hypothetical protein
MVDLKRFRWPILTIIITIIALSLLIAFGFTIGILSNNPDGLERVLEDFGSAEFSEFWYPILSWIENEYIAGIVGIVLSAILVGGVFYLLYFFKQQHSLKESV